MPCLSLSRPKKSIPKRHVHALFPQHVESGSGGDLVNQMKADEQLRLSRGQDVNGVGFPNFIVERAR
jgi:hypothetical protein